LSDAELIDKFTANAGHALSDDHLQRVVEETLNVERVASIGDYMLQLKRDR
jgi:hypothetical protein